MRLASLRTNKAVRLCNWSIRYLDFTLSLSAVISIEFIDWRFLRSVPTRPHNATAATENNTTKAEPLIHNS